MKIVIEIDDDDYQFIKDTEFENYAVTKHLYEAVYEGTPLPKGHGRLIDADELLIELGSYHIGGIDAIKIYNGENTWEDGLHTAWSVIDDAETIIEAESEKE